VQHGGRLDYESHPGRGTVARITLPDSLIQEGSPHGESAAGR
jgi:signal transduction histidine kinase